MADQTYPERILLTGARHGVAADLKQALGLVEGPDLLGTDELDLLGGTGRWIRTEPVRQMSALRMEPPWQLVVFRPRVGTQR